MTNIATIASGPDFSILKSTLQFIDTTIPGSNLIGTLSGAGNFTVFAPTNAAFGQLAKDLGFAGDSTDEAAVTDFLTTQVAPEVLDTVVQYHVLPEARTAFEISRGNPFLSTLNGLTLFYDNLTLVDNEPGLLDATLTQVDIGADNGVVHVVDRVLIPVDLDIEAPGLFDFLGGKGNFTYDDNPDDFDIARPFFYYGNIFSARGELDRDGADLTFFLPTDAAFIELAAQFGLENAADMDEQDVVFFLSDVFQLQQNMGAGFLGSIINRHILDESLQSSQIFSAETLSVTGPRSDTFTGSTFLPKITPDAQTLTLRDSNDFFPDPTIIQADIQLETGVAHVIDAVFLPDWASVPRGNNDLVIGGAGNEFFDVGAGQDSVSAQEGNDSIRGRGGDDVIFGGDGDDRIAGNRGKDLLFGDFGDDTIFGGKQDDTVNGGRGRDEIRGGNGDDSLRGESGNDILYGGSGDDQIDGGSNRDRLLGRNGDDTLSGSSDQDTLVGGRGDDLLYGDRVSGVGTQEGAASGDVFIFRGLDFGNDTIADFDARFDRIDLNRLSQMERDAIEVSEVSNGVLISVGANGTILLDGVGPIAGLGEDFLT